MENTTYDELEELGIHELRTLARSVGVKSPTSKKRQVLIDEIRQIKSGQAKPQFNKRFGRPVKNHGSQDALFSKLIAMGDEELESKLETSNNASFGEIKYEQNLKDFDGEACLKLIDVKGYVRKTQKNGYYFLNYKKISKKVYIIITEEFIEKYNLIEGDIIEGYAYLNSKTNFAKLKSIITLNGTNPADNIYNEEKDFVLPEKVIDIHDFKLGQSQLICTQNRDSSINLINEKVNSLKIDNVKYVALGVDISIETKLKLDKISNLIQVTSMNEETSSFSKDTLIDAINVINSLYYHGYNVVLFILNSLHIYDILDDVYGNNGKHNENVIMTIKKLFSQCKASNDSSVTIYGMYYNEQIPEYTNELKFVEKIINS